MSGVFVNIRNRINELERAPESINLLVLGEIRELIKSLQSMIDERAALTRQVIEGHEEWLDVGWVISQVLRKVSLKAPGEFDSAIHIDQSLAVSAGSKVMEEILKNLINNCAKAMIDAEPSSQSGQPITRHRLDIWVEKVNCNGEQIVRIRMEHTGRLMPEEI